MDSKAKQARSRILREINSHRENPFHSPPSSTGSHGTVTLTSDLDISINPDGEGTRRFQDDSIELPGLYGPLFSKPDARTTSKSPYKLNTSALGRDFPEWKEQELNSPDITDIYNVTGDQAYQGKENIPPSSSTAASPSDFKASHHHHHKHQQHFSVGGGTYRTRDEMQPRVDDNESECGDIRTSKPSGPTTTYHVTRPSANHSPRPAAISTMRTSSGSKRSGQNVTMLIHNLRAAQDAASQDNTPHNSPKPAVATPVQRPAVPAVQHLRLDSLNMQPPTPNLTSRSCYVPNLAHINDIASGALKLASTKDGVPVFVKHGKVHDHDTRAISAPHNQIDAINVPDDEHKIFVSLDKIREEIQALQAHDDHVSRQAEQLQEAVYELQIQLAKQRTRTDSGVGSDSDGSVIDYLNAQKSELETKVAALGAKHMKEIAVLEAKLDKANSKLRMDEMSHRNYMSERSEIIRTSSTEQSELAKVNAALQQKNAELQEEIRRLERVVKTTRNELELLQNELTNVKKERRGLTEDNMSLERHNDDLFNKHKLLQQELSELKAMSRNSSQHKTSMLERRLQDLETENEQLHEMIDLAAVDNATMTGDLKDGKDRLERKVQQLGKENSRLQERILDLENEVVQERAAFDKKRQHLDFLVNQGNERFDRLSKQFENILEESKAEAVRYEEKTTCLTQQLQAIAERESALANRLKESAVKETTLHHEIQRKNDAVEEARRLAREIEDIKNTTEKIKPVKITRIIEPTITASRDKSTTAETSTAKNTASQNDVPMEEDYTREIDLTKGSDYGSVFPDGEIEKMRNAIRQAKANGQRVVSNVLSHNETSRRDLTTEREATRRSTAERNHTQRDFTKNEMTVDLDDDVEYSSDDEDDFDDPSQVLPPMPSMQRRDSTHHDTARSVSAAQRKDSTHREQTQPQNENNTDVNMTSALFMEDITMAFRKRAAEKEKNHNSNDKKDITATAIPKLSAEAKLVLDRLCCDHNCRNCIVCTRINSHNSQHAQDDAAAANSNNNLKITVQVKKPVPVTDRVPNPARVSVLAATADDQPTMRPSQDPGIALAKTIKSLQDELAHLETDLTKKQALYRGADPSCGRRKQNALFQESAKLMRLVKMKKRQIYDLFDVLEGQKSAGQEMREDECDVTALSGFEVGSGEETWSGIVE